MGLDLVEVADKADPPVCRIMDYGKFKYEQSQRAKESRKKATHVLVKEMKYRPKIGPGDFDTKTRKVEQFLGDGSKVKVTIMFRGREMQHPELGRRILDRVAETVASMFTLGRVDRVELVYTEFMSIGSQKVTTRRFLPLESTETIAAVGGGEAAVSGSFEFEPSPEAVLAALLPRYVEARLFGALLESAASEHANRQRAMKAATDNAEELITKLSREMNRARQDSITTEIMEIVSGAEALGSDDETEDRPAAVGVEA
jgi:translation initiation factor IF-3